MKRKLFKSLAFTGVVMGMALQHPPKKTCE